MDTSQAAPGLPQRRRRRIIPIIDARFQWKYTILITALGVGVMAVMGGLLYKAHRDNTRLLDIDQRLQEQVIRGDQIFLLYLIMCVIAMAVVLAIWGLIVTHRISGPLYLVARYLDVLADGEYPDVRPLRKRDELQEFFASFEEAINAMRSRDAMALRDIEAALAEAKEAGDKDAKSSLENTVKALDRRRDQLAQLLARSEGVLVE